MDQDHNEIRRSFPEYLTLTDEDDIILAECINEFETLIQTYRDEVGIICQIENKLCMVINQTPQSYIVDAYLELRKKHFKEQKTLRVSKYYEPNDVPSLLVLNDLFRGQVLLPTWPTIGSIGEDVQDTLIKIYNFNLGRIALHEIPFLWFPKLLKPYQNILNSLFDSQSQLRMDYRYYIAITGVAAHGCLSIYQLLVQQFAQFGGDMNWIDVGIDAIPVKLQRLVRICKILAYKPWEPSIQGCIQDLLKDWQKRDLVHALLIFIFYGALGCFALGNGINREVDLCVNEGSQNSSFISFQQPTPPRKDSEEISELNEKILQLLKESEGEELHQQQICSAKSTPQLEEVEMDSSVVNQAFKDRFLRYFGSMEIADTSNSFTILRSSEYSFQLNSYPVLKELFSGGASAMSEFLKEIKQMTRSSFGQETEISTGAFRKAIRVYSENIYRFQHDDIDYSTQMNKLLPRELKVYIKLMSQTPNKIMKSHIEAIPLKLSADERCHISLLTIAGKIETQLIYLSRSLLQYM